MFYIELLQKLFETFVNEMSTIIGDNRVGKPCLYTTFFQKNFCTCYAVLVHKCFTFIHLVK